MELPNGVRRITFMGLQATEVLLADGSRLVVLDLGAHIVVCDFANHESLFWLSKVSAFELGKPVRGGDFRCLWWFGMGLDGNQSPMHGPARISEWALTAVIPGNNSFTLMYQLNVPIELALYNKPFKAYLEIEFAKNTLKTTSAILNTGTEPMLVENMSHPYILVSDLSTIRLEGLEKVSFQDGIAGQQYSATHAPILFPGDKEVNQLYQNCDTSIVLYDAGFQRKIIVAKDRASTTLIWQVGRQKAVQLPDFDDECWRQTVSIETGFGKGDHRRLERGARTFTTTRYIVEAL